MTELIAPGDAPIMSACVLAGCHSLAYIDGELVGDQMEQAALKSIQWSYASGTSLSVALPLDFCGSSHGRFCVGIFPLAIERPSGERLLWACVGVGVQAMWRRTNAVVARWPF